MRELGDGKKVMKLFLNMQIGYLVNLIMDQELKTVLSKSIQIIVKENGMMNNVTLILLHMHYVRGERNESLAFV